ncbi:putative methyltransferase [Glycine soja]
MVVKGTQNIFEGEKKNFRLKGSSHLVPIRTFVFSHEDVPARQQACKLTLENLPDKVYETDWDRIMIDASKGYFAEAPARMAAVFSATVMARNRKGSGVTHVFLHDGDRKVEKVFAEEFL